MFSLLILPGDGIGPEVMTEVKRVISWFQDKRNLKIDIEEGLVCLLYTSPSPRDREKSRMPSSA